MGELLHQRGSGSHCAQLIFFFFFMTGMLKAPQSEKTCSLPEAFPASRAFLLGWKATTDGTVLRFSGSVNECCRRPFWWKICSLRGLVKLPTAKHSSCLGSHTADSLLSQRPVCMLCLKNSKRCCKKKSEKEKQYVRGVKLKYTTF